MIENLDNEIAPETYPVAVEDLFAPESNNINDVRSVELPYKVRIPSGETRTEYLLTSFERNIIELPSIQWFNENKVTVLYPKYPLKCDKYCYTVANNGYEIVRTDIGVIPYEKRGWYCNHSDLWSERMCFGIPLNKDQIRDVRDVIFSYIQQTFEEFIFDTPSDIQCLRCSRIFRRVFSPEILTWREILSLIQKTSTSGNEQLSVEVERKLQICNRDSQEHIEPITLKQFMEIYCDLYDGIDVSSKVKALYKHELKGKIKLMDIVERKQGSARTFDAKQLKKEWLVYKTIMSSLPPLKEI